MEDKVVYRGFLILHITAGKPHLEIYRGEDGLGGRVGGCYDTYDWAQVVIDEQIIKDRGYYIRGE